MPCIPCAMDDRVGEGSPAGRAELLVVQPQAPSTRVLIKIHAGTGTRPLTGAAACIRPVGAGPNGLPGRPGAEDRLTLMQQIVGSRPI
jgi:hypothetical protein